MDSKETSCLGADGTLGSDLVARLPQPMLARSGPLPEGSDWRFELELDGFGAIVSTTGGLRVRSQRGWNMTALVPELADPPLRLSMATRSSPLATTGWTPTAGFHKVCTSFEGQPVCAGYEAAAVVRSSNASVSASAGRYPIEANSSRASTSGSCSSGRPRAARQRPWPSRA